MDLTTTYLGLKLKNPLVASSSPLSRNLSKLKQLEEAGASAIVLHSLFEEQIALESEQTNQAMEELAYSFVEFSTYFPDTPGFQIGPEEYLEHIRKAKASLSIPVIGSLNAFSAGNWIRYAKLIEEAGADALELNMYWLSSELGLEGSTVEGFYRDVVGEVVRQTSLPVAVKLSPFFSSLPDMIRDLGKAGAKGAVLFNRFYQPDIDIEARDFVPHLKLSTSDDLLLPLRWIAILHQRVNVDLGLSSGVHSTADVLKGLMAGAAVTMMTSEILQHGLMRFGAILQELEEWMEPHGYDRLTDLCGCMSLRATANIAALEHANYVKVLSSYST
jgi:dihydroorotate dehydrogenase (fumarate)